MEIFSLALLGILIVISPGADFVLVLKNSLNQGRKSGLYTALGISMAICIHITYSLLGISYLISQYQWLYDIIRYAGSAYLIFLGVKGLMSSSAKMDSLAVNNQAIKAHKYVFQGFLCNALNPKTMLFFLSIFSQLISPEQADQSLALIYGGYMILLHAIWFSLVTLLFTSKGLEARLNAIKRPLNQACGAGLLVFGAFLAIKP
jgi:RhtB (resistance to homoserine/threonine) family protein